jgi:hypothetical protein
MKRSSIVFLQLVIVLIGIAAIAILLGEPHLEGRNANSTAFEVYFKDPFLAYAYVASISFFIALYQAFRLLGYTGNDQVFTSASVRAMRKIKICALVLLGFVLFGEIFFLLPYTDDPPAAITMGVLVTFGSIVVASAAAMFERVLQRAVDIKSENDLTV